MDSGYVKSVAYYADCLITLLSDCKNDDFVASVINCVCGRDKGGLDDLIVFAED